MFKFIIGLIIVSGLFSNVSQVNDNSLKFEIDEETINKVVEIGMDTTQDAISFVNSIINSFLQNAHNSQPPTDNADSTQNLKEY